MLAETSFYGSQPKILMTDDSLAEKNAMKKAWPESKQLLCVFHVLQILHFLGCVKIR